MKLNELRDNDGARKTRMRVGRGMASGKGKTSGRGQKGQKARNTVAVGFEGGQMPLYRRLPKRGFNNIFRQEFAVVNVGRIQKAIDAGKINAGDTLNIDALKAAGLVNNVKDGVRLLNKGEITAKISVEVNSASPAAVAAVEKAGGSVTVDAAE
ncbi:50S ribosomal protein L15 [Terasakiella sp. A23]|uniref:50S ribosomal protein L15 n=1 Tax=Terasakiella sp. FCG-A23 TaxID=3080561 RepID=UPI0029532057|nr:50S ribosomal protein L15 [Terasakiella sp. A23]MDV7338490.1 50S ribosomal protein L15 [Terasakiella sp. A23]